MLVLSRKQDEGLVVDDDIYITVKEITDDEVKIAIEAPEETDVQVPILADP